MSTDDAAATAEVVDEKEAARRAFAEDFGLFWEAAGSPRMEGRILGYLLIMDAPYISSADLASVLNASAGSVSTTTRRLVEGGWVRRHAIPGDRSHYFRMENDVWGGWLAGERRFLEKQRDLMERGLELGFTDGDARQRLINGRDYMTWVISYHRKMLVDWEAAKAERDGTPKP
ncbi:GbsR/MarR family transcriptional regulator [Salinibacterium soli]|uniref:MarR family transcriptional regulator n=1 Tax=Antiquaquibacter soli TaxID=3064523 RepID=A0ABT9BMP4_9MICO|nr:MarR family transcriptional regulator [Protaetiibacter sp. WY-16]MDO7882298.1 MarR family transcriptional regulator [Protaetiibacter sp. WY-16]